MQATSVIFNSKPILAPIHVYNDSKSSLVVTSQSNCVQRKRSIKLRSHRHSQSRAYLIRNKVSVTFFFICVFYQLTFVASRLRKFILRLLGK